MIFSVQPRGSRISARGGPFLGLGARTLLVAPGFSTSNKELLVTKGIATRNKKLVETSATLVVTGALLVVTRSY